MLLWPLKHHLTFPDYLQVITMTTSYYNYMQMTGNGVALQQRQQDLPAEESAGAFGHMQVGRTLLLNGPRDHIKKL